MTHAIQCPLIHCHNASIEQKDIALSQALQVSSKPWLVKLLPGLGLYLNINPASFAPWSARNKPDSRPASLQPAPQPASLQPAPQPASQSASLWIVSLQSVSQSASLGIISVWPACLDPVFPEPYEISSGTTLMSSGNLHLRRIHGPRSPSLVFLYCAAP